MIDFRHALAAVPCWDQQCQYLSEQNQSLTCDVILQNREELILFCEWLQQEGISSYLEIGVWTGRLLSFLAEHFCFKPFAACDLLHATRLGLPMHIPPQTQFFTGSSQELMYHRWRQQVGHIDVVMIDGDHAYKGVKRDFEINRRFSHRYLVFHDIANPLVPGPGQLWRELKGNKIEIICPNPALDNPQATMGIGIWSAA